MPQLHTDAWTTLTLPQLLLLLLLLGACQHHAGNCRGSIGARGGLHLGRPQVVHIGANVRRLPHLGLLRPGAQQMPRPFHCTVEDSNNS